MKVGILETGTVPSGLAERHGAYDAMMARLLGEGFETETFRAWRGEVPARPELCDGYLITGSSAGVYEAHAWIAPLAAFLVAARGRRPLVGICFGHQMLAHAFGGRVEKSERGWGLGLHRYRIAGQPAWAAGGDTFAIPASHQDQVVALPPGARAVAASAFTPFAALAYAGDALSFQGHPEFEPAFAKDLLDAVHRDRLPAADLRTHAASLDAPNDRARVGGWIRSFLQAAAERGRPASGRDIARPEPAVAGNP